MANFWYCCINNIYILILDLIIYYININFNIILYKIINIIYYSLLIAYFCFVFVIGNFSDIIHILP